MKKPIPDEMFTNLRAGRSRKAFPIKEKQNYDYVAIVVVLMIMACGAIFLLAEAIRVNEMRGCIASAYQATKYGHDLEANLAVCD